MEAAAPQPMAWEPRERESERTLLENVSRWGRVFLGWLRGLLGKAPLWKAPVVAPVVPCVLLLCSCGSLVVACMPSQGLGVPSQGLGGAVTGERGVLLLVFLCSPVGVLARLVTLGEPSYTWAA